MGEYWKSTAKHWCKFCNQWMADNKPTRSLHEGGKKHQERVAEYNRERREAKVAGQRADRDLQQELRDVERAARQAMQDDHETLRGQFASTSASSFLYGPPAQRQQQQFAVVDEDALLRSDPNFGVYEVRGQRYMDGTTHQDKLHSGSACEIFLEEAEEWAPARIVARSDLVVPNTSIVITSFEVSFRPFLAASASASASSAEGESKGAGIVDEKAAEAQPVSKMGVHADRLRIPLGPVELSSSDGTEPGPDPEHEHEPGAGAGAGQWNEVKAKAQEARVESTGLGGWTVVAVREVDEEAEAAAAEAAAAQAKAPAHELGGAHGAKRSGGGGGGANPNADSIEDEEGPSGSYRGVALGTDEAHDDEVYRVAQGQSVAFKKRPHPASASTSAAASVSAGLGAGGAAPPKKARATRKRDDDD